MQVMAPGGVVTFDSTLAYTQFYVDEQYLSAGSVPYGGSLVFTYPALTGKKINAFCTSPYNNGSIEGYMIFNCSVSYPSGVPTVTCRYTNQGDGIPGADGYLVVMYTGASQ